MNNWVEQKLDYLWVNLTGTALTYADSLPRDRTGTYKELCRAMEERFGDSQLAEVYKSELRSRQRISGESLPALGQEVRRLVQRAYPDIGAQGVEELAVERFREGLIDQEQRMAVHRSKARTLDDAIKAAMDTEAWQISERRVGGHHKVRVIGAVESQEMKELKDNIQLLTEIVKELNIQKDAPKVSTSRPFACFYCDKSGHMARDCMKRQADRKKMQSENSKQLC